VEALREIVAPAKFSAVVKANGYGHGLVEVARAIATDVDSFSVYNVEEAARLREAGVDVPMLVLGPVEPRDLELAGDLRVAIALWSKGAYRRDAARVGRADGRPLGIHAKIDTGVSRLGLDHDRATAGLASYLDDPDFALRGVFTHLAAAEELESAFTLMQLERFAQAIEPLRNRLAEREVTLHAAASAAAMLYPNSRLDMVRAGIAIYGIWPSPETQREAGGMLALEPALRWTTEIVAMRTVAENTSVGYGCTFHTARDSRIAVIPIGYAEGLPRALSNRGHALVHGKRVPIVGRICMNMAFLDVTGVPDAGTGSVVTLIGRDGGENIEANDLAVDAGTIGYEIVARLPAEVPRVYRGAATAAMAPARSSVPS